METLRPLASAARRTWCASLLVTLAAACASSGGAGSSSASSSSSGGGGGSSGARGASGDAGDGGDATALAITRLAYLRGGSGPRLLVEGSAPGDDVALVHVELLDASGQPTRVSDGAGGMVETVDLLVTASDQRFFTDMQSAAGFDAVVAGVRATPFDRESRGGASATAMIGDPPLRADGATCDARGFDACVPGDVCVPNAAGVTTCVLASAYRASTCGAAPVIDPDAGPLAIAGSTDRVALWGAPAGCVQAAAVGQSFPEGIARLHVGAATSLTLSTVDPATDFDTVLFVLPACGDGATAPLACNDDAFAGTTGSTVQLSDVAAGDYIVVVQSATSSGGSYHLSVRAP